MRHHRRKIRNKGWKGITKNHVETPALTVRPQPALREHSEGRSPAAPPHHQNKKRTRQFLRARSLRRTEILNRSTTRGLDLHHRSRNPDHR
jgi:hypothetical protein